MRYPTAMLHNQRTGRYHPLPFYHSPLPSESATDRTIRFKSVGHHTDGFATLAEALAFLQTEPEFIWDEAFFEWDGEGTPATVVFLDREHVDKLGAW